MSKFNFETILRLSQEKLKNTLHHELKKLGYKPKNNAKYLYAEGTVPVLLVAHLDTVHRELPRDICYSYEDTSPAQPHIIMSPQGIGGDDRSGVYMVMEIIKTTKCHVLFCTDEEIGGLGANAFTRSSIRPEVNYIVEIDRRGSNDAVFYDCDNPEFTNYITDFGFVEAHGSFSDISIIAPHLKIAAVNISAGYYHEHTKHEYIDMQVVKNNIKRIKQMVNTPIEKPFEYIESKFLYDKYLASKYITYYNTKTSSVEGNTTKDLVFVPQDVYLHGDDGEYLGDDDVFDYMLDPTNMDVYLYDYQTDVAYKVKGYTVHSINGFKPQLDNEYLVTVNVEE